MQSLGGSLGSLGSLYTSYSLKWHMYFYSLALCHFYARKVDKLPKLPKLPSRSLGQGFDTPLRCLVQFPILHQAFSVNHLAFTTQQALANGPRIQALAIAAFLVGAECVVQGIP